MSEHYIVAVVGRPATGKSSLVERLGDFLDVETMNVDDEIRRIYKSDELARNGNIDERFALLALHKQARQKNPDVISNYCLGGLDTMKPQGRIIDGLHNKYDIAKIAIKRRMFTIGLETTQNVLWERFRDEYDTDPNDYGKFLTYCDTVGTDGDFYGTQVDEIVDTTMAPAGIVLDASLPTHELFWQSYRAIEERTVS